MPAGGLLTIGATAGLGALSGLFGGNKTPKWVQQQQRYWAQRSRDQEAQAALDYGGTRGRAVEGFEDIYGSPGFNEEERAGLFYTPEELAALGYSPEEIAGLYMTPEEQASQRITPAYEANVLSTTLAPIAGASQRAQEALTRSAAARGNYGGGIGAVLEQMQQEQGRQGSSAALQAKLGLTDLRREGERYLSEQRRNTLGTIAQQRMRAAGIGSGQRIASMGAIGRARMGQQEFGAQGRAGLAQQDLQRMLGYGQTVGGPQPGPSTLGRTLGGAAQGALIGYKYGRRGSDTAEDDSTMPYMGSFFT